MEIPLEILNTLKCHECDESPHVHFYLRQSIQHNNLWDDKIIHCSYLSCGPVYLIHESEEAICGRCTKIALERKDTKVHLKKKRDDTKKTRNRQYESAAKLLLFPCQFARKGCTEKLPFTEGPHPHEISCKYKEHPCPILPNAGCEWNGPWDQLVDHCRREHFSKLVTNPFEQQPDFKGTYLDNYLMVAFNLLFLIHLKVCMKTSKIYNSVRLLGDQLKVPFYEFSIKIVRNKIELTKRGEVLPAGNLIVDEATSIVTDINGLIKILGDFNGVKFIISIVKITPELNRVLCRFCQIKIENSVGNSANGAGTVCADCKSKIVTCENVIKGCEFIDIDKLKCRKHELYFCDYIEKCPRCGVSLSDLTLFDHFASAAGHKAVKSKIGSIWRSKTQTGVIHFSLLSSDIFEIEVLCSYNLFTSSELLLSLKTSLSSEELRKYRCFIDISDPDTHSNQSLTPEIDYNQEYDWYVYVNLKNFSSSETKGLDIKVDIYKI